MIKEFSFQFNQIPVRRSEVEQLMGYQDSLLPEPFGSYLDEALKMAPELCDIQGAIRTVNELSFNEGQLLVNDIHFNVGKTIAKELRGSTSGLFFICTAGKRISDFSRELLFGEDPVKGYIYDIIGSVVVESVMDIIQEQMRLEMESSGYMITNRYSPGYCKWNVDDQHRLFSFFPPNCCGITLSPSALMEPIKSVSGFIGVGHDVRYRQHTCNICQQPDCLYRQLKKVS